MISPIRKSVFIFCLNDALGFTRSGVCPLAGLSILMSTPASPVVRVSVEISPLAFRLVRIPVPLIKPIHPTGTVIHSGRPPEPPVSARFSNGVWPAFALGKARIEPFRTLPSCAYARRPERSWSGLPLLKLSVLRCADQSPPVISAVLLEHIRIRSVLVIVLRIVRRTCVCIHRNLLFRKT